MAILKYATIIQKTKIWDTKAVFTLNVNYIQLNYDSIYHTPFDFVRS